MVCSTVRGRRIFYPWRWRPTASFRRHGRERIGRRKQGRKWKAAETWSYHSPPKNSTAFDKLIRRASFKRSILRRPPQHDLLDLLRQAEILVGDAADGMCLHFHPELAPGDG